MGENKNITVNPYPGERAYFMGVGVPDTCSCCHTGTEKALHKITVKDADGVRNNNSFVLCGDCLEELYGQIGHALHHTVNLNDKVWELAKCDDGQWHIFPMIVKNVCQYGSPRRLKSGELTVWNIYAESEDHVTYMYKNFYDAGKTLFFTEESAKAALRQHQEKD